MRSLCKQLYRKTDRQIRPSVLCIQKERTMKTAEKGIRTYNYVYVKTALMRTWAKRKKRGSEREVISKEERRQKSSIVLSEFETNADREHSVQSIIPFVLTLRAVDTYFTSGVKNALPWRRKGHSTEGEWRNAIKLWEPAPLAGSKHFKQRGQPPPPHTTWRRYTARNWKF